MERPHLPLPRRGSPSRLEDPEAECAFGIHSVSKAVIDCAVYEDGCRQSEQIKLDEALQRAEQTESGFVWMGLHDPTPAAVETIGRHFELHPLAIEDAIHAHQRPKLERHGDTLFMVLKTAQYIEEDDRIDIGELMVFAGERFVVTVRHGEACPLGMVRRELEEHPTLLEIGPGAVLYAVVDRVVDEYANVLENLEIDVEEIEQQVFSGGTNAAERIYRIKRQALAFKRAVGPLVEPLEKLSTGAWPPVDPRGAAYFADVLDHLMREKERVMSVDELLNTVLNANITQIAMRDNQDMRRISAYLAIAAAPTLVFGLYGTNFDRIPAVHDHNGFLIMVGFCVVLCALMFWRLRKADWL